MMSRLCCQSQSIHFAHCSLQKAYWTLTSMDIGCWVKQPLPTRLTPPTHRKSLKQILFAECIMNNGVKCWNENTHAYSSDPKQIPRRTNTLPWAIHCVCFSQLLNTWLKYLDLLKRYPLSVSKRSTCSCISTSSAGISQTLQEKTNRSWRQCTVSAFTSPFLLAQLHREWECGSVLFAVPPHLTAFLCYSWEVHQAVVTWADFILL